MQISSKKQHSNADKKGITIGLNQIRIKFQHSSQKVRTRPAPSSSCITAQWCILSILLYYVRYVLYMNRTNWVNELYFRKADSESFKSGSMTKLVLASLALTSMTNHSTFKQ